MPPRFRARAVAKLDDPSAERVRQEIDGRIRELQAVPILGGKLIRDISLPDGTTVTVSHGLGRKATVLLSPPRATGSATTGRIRDVTPILVAANQADARNQFCLKADDWGETVTLDAWVFT